MIGTGPAENRLDVAEAVNAIPLSHPEIVVAVSLPSNRYCMRSEFPVGLTIEMLERAFAVYVGRKHNVAVPDARLGSSWPEGARYRAGGGNRLLLFVSQTVHAVNLADARGEFADAECWSETCLKTMPKNAEA